MKKIILLTLLPLLTAYSHSSFAQSCSQNNNTLSGLAGLDSQGGNIFASVTSDTNECGCKSVRFNRDNTDTEAALSVLLSAKLANKKVRVDILDRTDCNSAYRVYIQ